MQEGPIKSAPTAAGRRRWRAGRSCCRCYPPGPAPAARDQTPAGRGRGPAGPGSFFSVDRRCFFECWPAPERSPSPGGRRFHPRCRRPAPDPCWRRPAIRPGRSSPGRCPAPVPGRGRTARLRQKRSQRISVSGALSGGISSSRRRWTSAASPGRPSRKGGR